MSTCYVIAAYSGQRRVLDYRAKADPLFYIKTHLKQLDLLAHDIDLVVLAYCGPHLLEVADYIHEVDFDFPLEVMTRQNIGMSYGAYSDVYERHRMKYDYYVFVEDDYFPVLDNFDTVLSKYLEDEKCAYICGLVSDGAPMNVMHAAISNGMARSSVLEEMFVKDSKLPHYDAKAGQECYGCHEIKGQVAFSNEMVKQG